MEWPYYKADEEYTLQASRHQVDIWRNNADYSREKQIKKPGFSSMQNAGF
jgi:hypothetical protein